MEQTQTAAKRDAHFLDDALLKTRSWLKDVKTELQLDSEEQALALLVAVLHALRDRLMVNEAVKFGAQLPTLIRGFYYQGWVPEHTPEKVRVTARFVEGVVHRIGERRMAKAPDPLDVTKGIFKILEKRLPQEMKNIKAGLPKEIRELKVTVVPHKHYESRMKEVPQWYQPESGAIR